MRYQQRQTEHEITLEPAAPAKAAVIWLHGLGADGTDFVPIVGQLGLPDSTPVRFLFPHAPLQPVTLNGGYVMRAWYDIKSFTPEGRADAAGLEQSVRRVHTLLEQQVAKGIDAAHIVLAGFSQGGAVALTAGLTYAKRLAGVLALSTYLPFPARLAAERSHANNDVPLLMCHGRMDPIVPVVMGVEGRDALLRLGYAVTWREYSMQHEVNPPELADIARWLRERLVVATSGR